MNKEYLEAQADISLTQMKDGIKQRLAQGNKISTIIAVVQSTIIHNIVVELQRPLLQAEKEFINNYLINEIKNF